MIKLNRKPVSPASSPASTVPAAKPDASFSARRHREERFLTVKQVAARWQISERQVHRFIAAEQLAVHKFGRSVRVAENDVLLFELRSR